MGERVAWVVFTMAVASAPFACGGGTAANESWQEDTDGTSTTSGSAATSNSDATHVMSEGICFDPAIPPPLPPLDCGPNSIVFENAGPPSNRVNFAIIGDGYTQAQLEPGGAYRAHIQTALDRRFHPVLGQPFLRYRKFVNICALKLASNGPICGSSALGCCGSDSSRLASCNMSRVNATFQSFAASLEIDWRAVVLNGSNWWNTGSVTMLWSGGNANSGSAALHEGGHAYHGLADEYSTCTGATCGSNTCGLHYVENPEVNSTGNCTTTTGKWNLWLGYNQPNGTGLHGTFTGSRYVSTQYRPSANSLMNSQFGTLPNTSMNAPSREKVVMDIWRYVRPVDTAEPPAGPVCNPSTLRVNVIDPAVINVDWSLNGSVVATNGGITFDVAARNLTPGTYTISARAYDNAGEDLVRYRNGGNWGRNNWARSEQIVTWTVDIQ